MKKQFWRFWVTGVLLSALVASAPLMSRAQVSSGNSAPATGDESTASAPGAVVSPQAAEMVKLAESGVGEDVLLAYAQNSAAPYNLTSDNLIYLKDVGLPESVVTAMINRDAALRGQPQTYVYNQKLYPATAPPTATLTPPPEPVPATPAQAAPQSVPASVPAPPVAAAPPPPVVVSTPPPEVNYFYSELAPYGAWVQVEGVGWCWQPRTVALNRSWRPYCDAGHWIYTDAGWYWESDYSWGWAPFHYGRWQLHDRCGWVWIPDTTWAPAWVTWRTVGDNCGWAPLPPHATFDVNLGYRFNGVAVGVSFDFGLRPGAFTFVAVRDFALHDLGHRRIAEVEVNRFYRQTVVINNYTVEKNRTVIINRGLPVERVRTVTHAEFKPVVIHEPARGPVRPGLSPAHDRSGTVIYRTELRAPAKQTTVAVQKVDDRHPVIRHTTVVASTPVRPVASPGRPAAPYAPAASAPRPSAPRPAAPPPSGKDDPDRRTESRASDKRIDSPKGAQHHREEDRRRPH